MAESPGDHPDPSDPDLDSRQDQKLRDLGARLKRARVEQRASRPDMRRQDVAMGRGMQMGVELVAGVLAGALLGWLADRWLGLSPWGIILGFVLGTAAGFMNVYRRAFSPDDQND